MKLVPRSIQLHPQKQGNIYNLRNIYFRKINRVKLNMCQSCSNGISNKLHQIIVKSIVTSYIRVVTTGSKLDYIKFAIIAVTTSDNKVAVMRANNNPSINNDIVVNRGIRRATIDSIYSRELDSAEV